MSQHCAETALLAFGSNLSFGDQPPEVTIALSLRTLAAHGLAVERVSRLFRTPCFPLGAGPDYINAAAVVTPRHDMGPDQVLAALHAVEHATGRARGHRWAGRTLDIDLLAMGDKVLPDADTQAHWRNLAFRDQLRLAPDRLILPHPRLQDRAFVLVPLAEVAPDWRHPLLDLTVTQMLARRPPAEIATVTALPDALD